MQLRVKWPGKAAYSAEQTASASGAGWVAETCKLGREVFVITTFLFCTSYIFIYEAYLRVITRAMCDVYRRIMFWVGLELLDFW